MNKWHYIYIVAWMLIGGMIGCFTFKLWLQPKAKPFKFDTSYPTQMLKYRDYPTLSDNTPDGVPALLEIKADGRTIGRRLHDGTLEGITEDEAEKDWPLPKVDLE